MNLISRVEAIFKSYTMPSMTVAIHGISVTTDEDDGLWFTNRKWTEITWEDWEKYYCALFTFAPEAFIYYLPSIISLSLQRPNEWLAPVDSIIAMLDMSPDIASFNDFFYERFVGHRCEVYDLLEDWILVLAENNIYSIDKLSRSIDVIKLLKSMLSDDSSHKK